MAAELIGRAGSLLPAAIGPVAAGLPLFEHLLYPLVQFVQAGKQVFVPGLEFQQGVEIRGSAVHRSTVFAGCEEVGVPNGIGLPAAGYSAEWQKST